MCIVEPLLDEHFEPAKHVRSISYGDLYAVVADCVSALLSYGLKPGDRVGSYSSNCIVSRDKILLPRTRE